MGEPRRGVDDAVIDEATKWFALLRSDAATDEDRREFDAWRNADPRHAKTYEETLSIWEDVGELDDLKGLATAPELARPHRPSRRAIVFGALAAAAALAVILPAIIYAQPAWLLPNVHATRTAETAQIGLPDGSVVDLAPKSKVRVAYSGRERRVFLQEGEAFFNVWKGDARAFFVVSGDAEARVTGTQFNVRRGPAGVTVSVAEGEVEVRRAPRSGADESGAEARLSAGEAVAAPANGDGLSEVIEAAPSTIGSWRAGRLTYKGAPLREFIADANRYSRIPIIADETLLELPLAASLRTDQIDSTIDGLPEILPLKVDRSRRDRIALRPALEGSR
ncbi:MAG TPA: FecR domain-containing protein [Parvularculaceae bacterium]|nr:FecR domain-containing protein [Parvularculaceae bacterium]